MYFGTSGEDRFREHMDLENEASPAFVTEVIGDIELSTSDMEVSTDDVDLSKIDYVIAYSENIKESNQEKINRNRRNYLENLKKNGLILILKVMT